MYRIWLIRKENPSNPERLGDCFKWKRHVNCSEGPTGATQINGNNLGKEIAWERISHTAGTKRGHGVKARNQTRKATRTGTGQRSADCIQGTILLTLQRTRKHINPSFLRNTLANLSSEVRKVAFNSVRILSRLFSCLRESYSPVPPTGKALGPALNLWYKVSVQQMLCEE